MQQVSYAYTPSGQRSSLTYPSGKVLGYRYDATGRLVQLDWDGAPLITHLAWTPLGQATRWTWAFVSPQRQATRTYDSAGRPDLTEFSRFIHDGAGRITNIAQWLSKPGDGDPTHDSLSAAFSFFNAGYDPVGRVRSFATTADAAGYGYDANGNRESSTRTRSGQTTSRNYLPDPFSNKLMGFSQVQGGATTEVVYQYNANGDLTGDGLRTYSYDAQGRLSAVTTGASDTSPTTRYAHNALGQRVFKTEAIYPPAQGDDNDPGFMQSLLGFFGKVLGSPTLTDAERLGFAFVYDEEGSLIAETGTGGANSTGSTQHIYLPTAGGPMPVAAIVNGQTYAVHSDHLNTPRQVANESGQVVWQWKYSGFGEDPPTTAKTRFADLQVNPNPGTTSLTVPTYNLRYAGQYFDAESGLHYNYFRSYDSRTGRYSQPDPIGLSGGWNRRMYVDGNPLTYKDPRGLQTAGMGLPNLEGEFNQYKDAMIDVYTNAIFIPLTDGAASAAKKACEVAGYKYGMAFLTAVNLWTKVPRNIPKVPPELKMSAARKAVKEISEAAKNAQPQPVPAQPYP